MRVLIVEDEKYLAEAVVYILKREGWDVDHAGDGEEGLEMALSKIYDVVVLDIMLPKLDGISILKRIRAENMSVPVLILSARGETDDKVNGLDAGADDYLAKPFKTAELCARIRALARREDKAIKKCVLEYGDIKLDTETYELKKGKDRFKLTSKEFKLMEILMESAEKIVNKEVVLAKIWGNGVYGEDNYVEVYVSFLRKKLKKLKTDVAIETVRGVGYRLGKKDV